MRVVALTPAAVEIMHCIGAADLLVGRSHDADWPPPMAAVPSVTTAAADDPDAALTAGRPRRRLDRARLEAVAPDLVLTHRGSCGREDAAAVRLAADRCGAAVCTLDPHSIEDVLDDIVRVGEACGRPAASTAAMVDLRARFWDARNHVNPYLDGPRTAVIDWTSPLSLAGRWTPGMIEAAGGVPIGPQPGESSRPVDPDELVQAQPERLIVAPCGRDQDAATRGAELLATEPWWRELPATRSGCVQSLGGRAALGRPGPGLFERFEWLVDWLSPQEPEAP
ncbi:MAG: ABC transporter substrate-binding protein [Phycisphaerales bacterium]|jgi:iron complex transport system substrate-binding protein|nr:ABC transporter substrate-binding protein [Phycisphaerales bacterium]